MGNQETTDVVSLHDYLQVLRRRKWVVLIVTLASALANRNSNVLMLART